MPVWSCFGSSGGYTRSISGLYRVLRRDAEKMKKVVEFLLEHETMTGEQFADCMEGHEIRAASDTALFDSYQENPNE